MILQTRTKLFSKLLGVQFFVNCTRIVMQLQMQIDFQVRTCVDGFSQLSIHKRRMIATQDSLIERTMLIYNRFHIVH